MLTKVSPEELERIAETFYPRLNQPAVDAGEDIPNWVDLSDAERATFIDITRDGIIKLNHHAMVPIEGTDEVAPYENPELLKTCEYMISPDFRNLMPRSVYFPQPEPVPEAPRRVVNVPVAANKRLEEKHAEEKLNRIE